MASLLPERDLLAHADAAGDIAARRSSRGAPAHTVQLYEADRHLCGVMATYVGEGLRAGAAAVVIATQAHRDALSRRLEDVALDVRDALRCGRLLFLDARETLGRVMVGRLPDEARFRAHVGSAVERAHAVAPSRPVRAYGEMVDLLWKDGNREAVLALERLWSDLARDHAFTVLCAYDLRGFRGDDLEPFDAICAQHTRVVPTETFPQSGPVDARLREVARLQQRARALEDEIAKRARAEAALRHGEQELRVQNEKLTEALRAKDEFLAMLGHELRNPLAPILAALDLVRSRGERWKELDTVERQVTHLVHLVDDLLDVSRLLHGTVEIRPRRVELAHVVERAVELAGPWLEGRQADVAVRVPASGLAVQADVVRMTQVVSNLLTNAAKYSDAGSPIVVSGEATGDGGVALRVTDHGVGIAPDLIERIFDPFVQQPQALDRAKGGLGLGLAIVRNIVRLHGGTVTARSDGPGTGAELTVVLPAAPAEHGAPRPGGAASDGRAQPRPAPTRILVVDDNEDSAALLAELLESLGHEVKVAHDGEAALAIASELSPDVALLDIGLPGPDGVEVGKRLRRLCPGLRLFAVSGYGDGGSRSRSSEAGFEAHLVKPVPFQELVEALKV